MAEPQETEQFYFVFSMEDFDNIRVFLECLESNEGPALMERFGIPSNDSFLVTFVSPDDADDHEPCHEVRRNDLGQFVSTIVADDFTVVVGNGKDTIIMPADTLLN